MNPELPKFLASSADLAKKLSDEIETFFGHLANLKTTLDQTHPVLTEVHKAVLADPVPGVMFPTHPPGAVDPVQAAIDEAPLETEETEPESEPPDEPAVIYETKADPQDNPDFVMPHHP